MRGAACAAVFLAAAGTCLGAAGRVSALALAGSLLAAIALAVSLYYTPDYLQLTVNPERKVRWEIKIRWRIIGAVLSFGALSYFQGRDGDGKAWIVVAIVWLLVINLLAQKAQLRRHVCAYFWAGDFILLAVLLLVRQCDLLLGAVLLAAAAHLSIVVCNDRSFQWAAAASISGGLLLLAAGMRLGAEEEFLAAASGLVLVSAFGTTLLVSHAQEQNENNVRAALSELVAFTGYSADRARELWSTSNVELAKNWQAAKLDENDSERMAEWYRQNSELYIFALSAYNFEYKRIRSNLGVMKLAKGSCLDYGAGNGELILELARRGHPAAYFDVEGKSMEFAKLRAEQRGLPVEFLHSKDALTNLAQQGGFDTIYSLDVLEHLPDLRGELRFLCSLLRAGGLLVFDVPAGSTKSHPMHLNHHLDVNAFLKEEGLQERRDLLHEAPIGKQEKYVFHRFQ